MGLVEQLLREQFPGLADQEVRPSDSSGSSNWVFRVSKECAVRLPRSDSYTAALLREAHFLPRLAPHLAVPVPEVRFLAEPSVRFPRPWTVATWVPGDTPGGLDTQSRRAWQSPWAGSCVAYTGWIPSASTPDRNGGVTGLANR